MHIFKIYYCRCILLWFVVWNLNMYPNYFEMRDVRPRQNVCSYLFALFVDINFKIVSLTCSDNNIWWTKIKWVWMLIQRIFYVGLCFFVRVLCSSCYVTSINAQKRLYGARFFMDTNANNNINFSIWRMCQNHNTLLLNHNN